MCVSVFVFNFMPLASKNVSVNTEDWPALSVVLDCLSLAGFSDVVKVGRERDGKIK